MRFQPIASADLRVFYRGYDIEVTRAPTGWVSEYIGGLPIYLFLGEVKFTPAIQIELSSKLRTVLTAHFASERLA